MRNYLQFFVQSWDIWAGGSQSGILTQFSKTIEEAIAFAQTLPPFNGSDGFDSQGAAAPIFILMDKSAIQFALNSGAPFANSAAQESTSPRHGINGSFATGWPSNDGDPKGPTFNVHLGDARRFKADYAGASGLYEAFTALAQYAAQLRAAGRLRDAGIVQFAYDQVAKQIWSITEAFNYLGDNHLV